MRGYIPGHTESEIRAAFSEKFGIVLTESQIGNTKVRLGIKSGTHGGRFARGHATHNKGRKQSEWMTPEQIERTCATRFSKGHEPSQGQAIPVGSERISKGGCIEVKVRRFSNRPCANKCWRMKHHIVWEEANGRPVPPHTVIVFADGDKRNFDPDNLVAVPRSIWVTIKGKHIPYYDRESLLIAVDIAKLRSGIFDAQTRPRACRKCGNEFKPRFEGQRTCDCCLGRNEESNG